MLIKWGGLALVIILLCLSGCRTLEQANRGAEEAGKNAGQVMRIPHSTSEGAAKGIAGESESNPYHR